MLTDISGLTGYLNTEFSCSCGKCHRTPLKTIIINASAADSLAQRIRTSGCLVPLLAADRNTWHAAGELLAGALEREGISFRLHLFKEEEIHPDESSVGSLLMACEPDVDLLVAVGSGTLNDITRFVSFRMKLPYYIFGTAPSMDGFASNVAAMTTNNAKITYPSHTPDAIFADPAVLADAPAVLVQAGFGDILGKFTCLTDWKLSSVINGEYYCSEIADLTAKARDLTVSLRTGLAAGEPSSLVRLTEALILSGIAMSFSGNSRPASGSEHHLSHFWEMKFLAEGKKDVPHGIKVGIGTEISLKLYELLRETDPDFEKIKSRTFPDNHEAWKREIRRAFGPAANEVISLEEKTGKNSRAGWEQRIARIESEWRGIREIMEQLPTQADADAYLSEVGCPIRPAEIGLDRQTVIDGILYAKEVRDRYTILQLLWDLGLLEEFAVKTADFFFQ